MGRYSYSQPSSSDEYGEEYDRILQEEADLYANGTEVQYPLQTEADDGIPKTCYCGAEPVVATAYTTKDPGRRYFTCDNADDGDCHVWKWWDVAVLEELSDYQRQLRQLKVKGKEMDQKLVKLEQTVGELAEKKSWVTNALPLVVYVMVLICVVVMIKWERQGELQMLKRQITSDL